MAYGGHLENVSNRKDSAVHTLLDFAEIQFANALWILGGAKKEPEVEISRQRPPFQVSFTGHIATAD